VGVLQKREVLRVVTRRVAMRGKEGMYDLRGGIGEISNKWRI
jgi:hypothetical protein